MYDVPHGSVLVFCFAWVCVRSYVQVCFVSVLAFVRMGRHTVTVSTALGAGMGSIYENVQYIYTTHAICMMHSLPQDNRTDDNPLGPLWCMVQQEHFVIKIVVYYTLQWDIILI